jgi:hypothetical protein
LIRSPIVGVAARFSDAVLAQPITFMLNATSATPTNAIPFFMQHLLHVVLSLYR